MNAVIGRFAVVALFVLAAAGSVCSRAEAQTATIQYGTGLGNGFTSRKLSVNEAT